jgi:hypothetical protein
MIRKFLKIGAAVAVVALSAWGAVALDVDQTRTAVVRAPLTQQTSYYRITVNFNDPRISTAQIFGKLLQNTYITGLSCHVTTAFNAGTTNVFTMGTSLAAANELIQATQSTKSIDETSVTYQPITHISALGVSVTSAADVNLYAKYTQSGGAATAGSLTCILEFIPNNDM